jgi:DNA-binding PadR family transcriptional regulator
MSALRDKKLLLLGILLHTRVHGYELNQLLKSPASTIRIGKANAYQILAKMEAQGLVSSEQKQEGKRPPRQVYSITTKGKEELFQLLRESLAQYEPLEYPNGVSLDLLALIQPQEALPLLQQRRERLALHCKTLAGFSDDIRASHPGLDFLIRQASLEKELLDEIINKNSG